MKCYKTAPLPFQGQKRRFVGAFAQAMKELKEKKRIDIIVDLFGGSGLLSHTAKQIFSGTKVVYNDYDNYSYRLKNIGQTNKLLSDIRQIIGDYPRDTRLPDEYSKAIFKRVKEEDNKGYVDYITISSSLMFSARYVLNFKGLVKEKLYNNVKIQDYNIDVNFYLAGLEIVHVDYKMLFNQYKDMPYVLFIVDPPYLSTDTKTYSSDKYWRLRDYLDVLKVLNDNNYIFFTSDKSSLIELCEWMAENKYLGNPFENSVLNKQNITINKTAGYTDMMLYKFFEE